MLKPKLAPNFLIQFLPLFVVATVLLGGCGSKTFNEKTTLKIAVAANMTYAIKEIEQEFEKEYTNIDVEIILGSSGRLTSQIMKDAPYDVFLAANMKFPQKLYDEGYAVSKPVVYAKGKLILLSTKALDFSKGLDILTDDKVESIAIANYKVAPYGKAAVDAMKNYGIFEKTEAKLLDAENVGKAVQFTVTAADAGFVAYSSIFSDALKDYRVEGEHFIAIDEKLYSPILQGMLVLKKTEHRKEADVFFNFMKSDITKTILEKNGYGHE